MIKHPTKKQQIDRLLSYLNEAAENTVPDMDEVLGHYATQVVGEAGYLLNADDPRDDHSQQAQEISEAVVYVPGHWRRRRK